MASSTIIERYQQPLWGRLDRALRNCFIAASAIGVAVLIAVFVAPTPPLVPQTIDDVPERIARLILEKPAKPAPVAPPPERVVVEAPPVKARPKVADKPRPRRTSKPRVAENTGAQGRAKAAKDVTQNLAAVTGSLDKALDDLSTSLKSSSDAPVHAGKKAPRRRVRPGRSNRQLASVGGLSTMAGPDISGSAITSDGISISAISDLTVSGGGDTTSPGASSGAASGSTLRSNQSLLSAVRRYTPGIQFCYDNELKKHPGLRGKLVVSITVLASGRIDEALVVEDDLGSPAVTRCVLAQIRGWQLPEIPEGIVTFKTPFVFTPPE